jgi:hypothetical protein
VVPAAEADAPKAEAGSVAVEETALPAEEPKVEEAPAEETSS